MTPTDRAAAAIADQLNALDLRDIAAGRPTLADQDLDWKTRKSILISACHGLPDTRPGYGQVALVGALAAAFLCALEAAEEVDVSSGEAT